MHPFFDVEAPIILGHRGAAGERPENTLASFEHALETGAGILESDIQISSDGIPVLFHDETLERTTGASGRVDAMSLAELRTLDAGACFVDAGGARAWRGRGLRIPTLEEAFECLPDARFNLEIKTDRPAAIGATLDRVERFGRAERTLLTAAEDDTMATLRALLAERKIRPATGACLAEIVAAVQAAVSGDPMPPGVMALQVPPAFMGDPLVTRPFVEHAHRNGIQVHVWTLNEWSEIEPMLALGVDGIVTDHPGRLAERLGR
jgi:glycerophosphoryl diester phosphodiesterase